MTDAHDAAPSPPSQHREPIEADRQAAWQHRPSCYKVDDYTDWMAGKYDMAAPIIGTMMAHRLAFSTPAASEADAIAEGVRKLDVDGHWYDVEQRETPCISRDPVRCYRNLWESINGAGAWDANPWVVAVSFDVRKGNIDG